MPVELPASPTATIILPPMVGTVKSVRVSPRVRGSFRALKARAEGTVRRQKRYTGWASLSRQKSLGTMIR
jgi:hypothetical protein